MPLQDLIQGLLRLVGRDIPIEERRETLRLRCEVEILLWVEGEIHKAKVLDVHTTGLCLEAAEPLKVGQKVSLARDDFGHPWEGEVLWCRPRSKAKGYLAGVGFPTDPEMLRNSWLQPSLLSIGFQTGLLEEKRKLLRVPSGLVSGRLSDLLGQPLGEVQILNLSLGGAQLKSAQQQHETSSLTLQIEPGKGLPKLRCLVKVMYCQAAAEGNWLVGVRFKEKDEADLRKVISSLIISR